MRASSRMCAEGRAVRFKTPTFGKVTNLHSVRLRAHIFGTRLSFFSWRRAFLVRDNFDVTAAKRRYRRERSVLRRCVFAALSTRSGVRSASHAAAHFE